MPPRQSGDPQPRRNPRRDTKAMERRWKRTQRAELQFARALRRVAARCGALTRGTFKAERPLSSSAEVRRELERYGTTLQSWAKATASRMVLDVARRDERFWFEQSREIGKNLRDEIKKAPVGIAVRERTAEAAALITSLPLEAAQRIEVYAVDYMTRGIRASELVKRVMATGEVTRSRANTIARTETSRTAGLLQEVRAKAVDSPGYIWRTVRDADVRDRHEALEGTYHTWDRPPITGENGERSHPGGIYNCFTPETLIAPADGHVSVFRSHYSGPLVILIAGEATLRVTPNHPILTTRGWLAAAQIKEGDNLINVPLENRNRVKQNVDCGLVSFSEIFESSSLTRKTTPFLVNGFYGDVIDEHVDIVVPELYLPPDLKPGILQCLGKEVVPSPNSRIFRLAVTGSLPEVIEASFAGFRHDSFPLIFGSVFKPGFVGLTDRTFGNPGFYENSVDDCPGTAVALMNCGDAFAPEILSNYPFLGKIEQLISSSNVGDPSSVLFWGKSLESHLHRFAYGSDFGVGSLESPANSSTRAPVQFSNKPYAEAGQVVVNDLLIRQIAAAINAGDVGVVKVTGRFLDRFTGHVFTSETATGYYRVSSENILSKNCRCWAEVVLPGERPRIRASRFRAEEVA